MDNNANNYMLLQQRNVRIPLLAKNGTWKFTINKEKWAVPACMECLYAYYLIGKQDYKGTSATLHANYKHITPIQIEAFIQHFEKTHPVEEYPFDINEVPVYATDKRPLQIPTNQSHQILLTPEQEKEVLDLIKNSTETDRRAPINKWFARYVYRYGLSVRNQNRTYVYNKQLAEWFCQLHGIDYKKLEQKICEGDMPGNGKVALIMIGGGLVYILCKVAIAALGFGAIWLFLYFLYS